MKTLATTKNFILKFTPKAVIPANASRYLSQPFNPIRPKIEYLCDNRDPNTLWWRVSVKNLNDRKRVVRSWCARRARMAFKQELKERGFDAEGRRKVVESRSYLDSTAPDDVAGNLRGSATIFATPACIQAEYSEVQADMKALVNVLFRQQQMMRFKETKPLPLSKMQKPWDSRRKDKSKAHTE